ncbi:MAG: hypothetical protein JXR07_14965 [Reichenbachiella sp.]
MFESSDYPKSLDESVFSEWLEKGRANKIRYNFLLIVWDEFECNYQPVYLELRKEIEAYNERSNISSRESLIAVYDLYSESRISLSY